VGPFLRLLADTRFTSRASTSLRLPSLLGSPVAEGDELSCPPTPYPPVGDYCLGALLKPQESSIVGAERIDDLPQLFNFIEVSRHRIGGWFRHVLGRSLVAFHATGEALAVEVNLDKAFAALVTNAHGQAVQTS
jgi:hypothetical protein